MRNFLKKLAALAIFCAPAALIITANVYAETGGEIMITEDGIVYESDPSAEVHEEGLDWNSSTKTLTLTNYHSKTITIYIEDADVNLVLNGENSFEAEGEEFLGLTVAVKNLIVSGDGTLGIEGSTGSTLLFPMGGGVTMNSGKVISRCAVGYEFVVLNDGEFIIDGADYGVSGLTLCDIMLLNINKGTLSSNIGIDGLAFNQNGGDLNIASPGPTGNMHTDFDSNPSALGYEFITFNGGKSNIKGGGATGLAIFDGDSKENVQQYIDDFGIANMSLPKNGFVEFNDGDITIESEGIYGSIVIMLYADPSLIDDAVAINSKLLVDPAGAKYTVAELTTDYGTSRYGFMNNGEGETTMSYDGDGGGGNLVITNVAKKVHLFTEKDDEPEENIDVPNSGAHISIDVQASATLLATITGIIAALITYKTLRKTE